MVSTAAIESTPIDHTSDQIVLEVNDNLVWPTARQERRAQLPNLHIELLSPTAVELQHSVDAE